MVSIPSGKYSRQTKEAICWLYDVWQNSKIDLYPKLALPQSFDLHSSDKKIKIVFGGNRGGKTQSAACEVVQIARGIHFWREVRRPPVQVWVLSEDLDTLRTVQRKAILEWLPANEIERDVWNNTERIIELTNGSQIHFKSYTRGSAQLQGRKIDCVWFDEEPKDPQILDECEMRLLDRQGTMLISCTPLQGYTVTYYRFVRNEAQDDEVACWYYWQEHNIYLPWVQIERNRNRWPKDSPQYKSRMHGEHSLSTGLVYGDSYSPDFHVLTREKALEIEMRRKAENWPLLRALDPSPSNFICTCYATAPEGDVYCFREMYWKNAALSEIARDIQAACWGERYNMTVCGVHGADAHAINELPRHGIPLVGATDFYPNLVGGEPSHQLAGIARVKEWLKGIPINAPIYQRTLKCPKCLYVVNVDLRKPECPHCKAAVDAPRKIDTGKKKYFYIFPDCKHTIEEAQLYRWNEKGDAPVKENDHAWDAHRYALSTFPAPRIPKETVKAYTLEYFNNEIAKSTTARALIGG